MGENIVKQYEFHYYQAYFQYSIINSIFFIQSMDCYFKFI